MPVRAANRPIRRSGQRKAEGEEPAAATIARAAVVRATRSTSPMFWMPRRSCASSGLSIARSTRDAGCAPVSGAAGARAAVKSLALLASVEILVDVDVVMENVKPPQQPLRAARVLAPVGAV